MPVRFPYLCVCLRYVNVIPILKINPYPSRSSNTLIKYPVPVPVMFTLRTWVHKGTWEGGVRIPFTFFRIWFGLVFSAPPVRLMIWRRCTTGILKKKKSHPRSGRLYYCDFSIFFIFLPAARRDVHILSWFWLKIPLYMLPRAKF